MNSLLYSALMLFGASLLALEDSEHIKFGVMLNDAPVVLNETYFSSDIGDSVQFERIKFYVSNIQFYDNGKLVHTLEERYHLIDLEDPKSQNIDFNWDGGFDKIKFDVGVDSAMSVSGAHGGALDPMHGMYWAWQSGYINFKLEGTTAACPARHNLFQYHVGGYQHPFNMLQTVELDVTDTQNLSIQLNLGAFFKAVDVKTAYQVMSPNQKAMDVASVLPQLFSIAR